MQLYPTEQGKTWIARIAFPKLHLGRYLLLDIAFNVCLSKTEECPSMVLLPLDFNQNHCILADIWFSMIWCILPGIASNTFLSKTNILNYGFEGMPKCGVTPLLSPLFADVAFEQGSGSYGSAADHLLPFVRHYIQFPSSLFGT